MSVYQREDAMVLIDVQASDFRCLKSAVSMWTLSEWENRQLVFYALDPITRQGTGLATHEIAFGPMLRTPTGTFLPTARACYYDAARHPNAYQNCAFAQWYPKRYLCPRRARRFSRFEWAADGMGRYVARRSAAMSTVSFVDPPRHASTCAKPSRATTRTPSRHLTATTWLSLNTSTQTMSRWSRTSNENDSGNSFQPDGS